MNQLRYIHTFTRVAEVKSFSAAAEQLQMTKSAVSKQISNLEHILGAQLIVRTTRKLSLTLAGEAYLKYCSQILEIEKEAENHINAFNSKPSGLLRIASDQSFACLYLPEIIKRFQSDYPDITIELLVEDKIINMVENNVDLTIRVGWLQDSAMIARKLFESEMIVFSSPQYMEKYRPPTQPEDLTELKWVTLNLLRSPSIWHFKNGSSVHMQPAISTNSVPALISLIENGFGISALAEYVIKDKLESGNLVRVLPGHQLKKLGVYAVYPNKTNMPVKTRLAVEHLVNYFVDQPHY